MKIITLVCASRAFRRQLEESRNRLYRMALAWCGDPMLADDLVQEALTKALQKANQLRDQDKLGCWLYSILNNCWREHLRRQRPNVEIDEDEYICENCPEVQSSSQEVVNRVRAAIARLALGQREVVTLVDLEGFAYAEVAEILSVPIGTVMSRLSRARKALQQELLDIQPEQSIRRTHLRRVK